MPSNHLILCRPLLLLHSIFPSIRIFSNESAQRIRWPKYWSFSFNISPSMNTQDWSPLGWTGWISLKSKGLSRVFSNTTVQKHQFFGTQLSWQSRLVVLIPQAVMEWSKRREKKWPRKESSLHTLCPFLATPLEGMLSASWHWQVSINPQQAPLLGAAFNHYEAPHNHRPGLITCFVQGMSFFHTSTP